MPQQQAVNHGSGMISTSIFEAMNRSCTASQLDDDRGVYTAVHARERAQEHHRHYTHRTVVPEMQVVFAGKRD